MGDIYIYIYIYIYISQKKYIYIYLKETQDSPKRAPNGQNWNNLSNKINKVVLDYNAKYKISISELILI